MRDLMRESDVNKFVIERGLLDLKKIQKQEKKRSKEERDIINAMKPFARFTEKKEHERRVNNLLKEYQLRVLIGQLKYFRAQGLTSLDQIETYIEEKKKEGKFDENKDGNTLNFIKKQISYLSVESGGSSRNRRAPNISLEIANASGFNSLTEDEKDLVIKINIMPDNYLEIKNLFIEEFEDKGEVPESYINDATKKIGENVNPQQSVGKYLLYYITFLKNDLTNIL
jgi:transcriptional adapter 2-alpha